MVLWKNMIFTEGKEADPTRLIHGMKARKYEGYISGQKIN